MDLFSFYMETNSLHNFKMKSIKLKIHFDIWETVQLTVWSMSSTNIIYIKCRTIVHNKEKLLFIAGYGLEWNQPFNFALQALLPIHFIIHFCYTIFLSSTYHYYSDLHGKQHPYISWLSHCKEQDIYKLKN